VRACCHARTHRFDVDTGTHLSRVGRLMASLTDLLAVLAGSFGVVMGASPLLQAVRSHRRQSASDVSLSFLAILVCGGTAWLLYGIALGNVVLITANGVGVASSGTALIVTARWRRGR
jgi:uncharacterized protein with PQ loop repeat